MVIDNMVIRNHRLDRYLEEVSDVELKRRQRMLNQYVRAIGTIAALAAELGCSFREVCP